MMYNLSFSRSADLRLRFACIIFVMLCLMFTSKVHAQEEETADAVPEAVNEGEAEARDADAEDTEGEEAEAEDIEEDEFEVGPDTFDDALADFYARRYEDAADGFWSYVHFGEPSAENYEWAQYFLAESLRSLGLWHGSVQYYYIVASTRSQPEILPEALGRLEAISRYRPFSESLILEDLLYDSEFGSIRNDLAGWVHYVQGLYDLRNGFVRWADRHFEQVGETSYYGLMSLYVRAVYALKNKKDDKALAFFQTIVEATRDAPDVKNKAYLAMARLLFDNGNYTQALQYYDKVLQIKLSYEQAQLLLEKAWAHYYLHENRKAMGLLHALRAPSYAKMFLPDAFVLRAIILKEMCHFIEAKRVARSFRYSYQETLDQLHQRVSMRKISRIVDGATQEGAIARRTALLRSMEKERRLIEDHDSAWEDSGLAQHLRRMYDLEIREQARLWSITFQKRADATALELLEVEEQVNLLDYEVGLDIFKRLKKGSTQRIAEELVVPYDSKNIYYGFDTEFWNDELHSYQFFISSRCFESKEQG